jgi:threonine synthase
VSPETAAVLSAIRSLSASGWLDADEQVVAFDTGIGHKYPPPPGLPAPPLVAADVEPDRLRALLGS